MKVKKKTSQMKDRKIRKKSKNIHFMTHVDYSLIEKYMRANVDLSQTKFYIQQITRKQRIFIQK